MSFLLLFIQQISKLLRRGLLLSAAIIAILINPAIGKESDSEQPIGYSNTGSGSIRNQGGMRVISISDNVRITQGTMEISGDFAKLEYDLETDELIQVTIEGTPATYQQELDDGSDVNGESDTIFYFASGDINVEFVENAMFRQQGNTMNCAAIKHFLDTEFTDYTGPCEGLLINAANEESLESDNATD